MSTRRAHGLEKLEPVSSRPRRADEAARLRDLLRVEIVSGRYGLGVPLPSERELCLEYAVGRNVVRDALALLRNEGLIERIQGAGTLVLTTKARHRFDRVHAINDSVQRNGRVAGVMLSTALVTAPGPVATQLRIEPGTRCMLLEYTAVIGNLPFSVSSSYLALDVAERLDCGSFDGDFYQLLEDAGFVVAGGELTVEAIAADERAAAIVHVAPGSPLVLFHRRLVRPDGWPLEVGFVRCRGDRLTLQIELPRAVKGETS